MIHEHQMQALCERYVSTSRLLDHARQSCIERLGDSLCDGSSEPPDAVQLAELDALTEAQATARRLYEACCLVAARGIVWRIGGAAARTKINRD